VKVAEFLRKVATGTGLITFADATKSPEPAAIQTQSISLAELQQKFKNPRQEQAAFSITFDALFQAMKVPSYAHGWSAESVRKYIESNDIAGLAHEKKKETVLRALKENNVSLEDIVVDAVRRDEALDAYERFAEKKLQEKKSQHQAEIAGLESEIENCHAKIRSLREMQARDAEEFGRWISKKTAHEEELVRVVSLITNESKISVGSVTNNKK
jgi:hypothetical protein